jgi:WD40 repeat protein
MTSLDEFMKRTHGTGLGLAAPAPQPENLSEACSILKSYITKNLPRVIETELIPLCFDISRYETSLIIGGRQGNIASFDLSLQKLTKDTELCSCPIVSIMFALGESLIVCTTQIMSLYIVSFPEMFALLSLPLGPEPIQALPGLGLGSLVVTNCTEKVTVFDLAVISEANGRLPQRNLTMPGPAVCMDVAEDGSIIAFGLMDGGIQLFHCESEALLQRTESLGGKINKICLSQGHKFVAAIVDSIQVIVLSIGSDCQVKFKSQGHKGKISALSFVKDDRYLATGGQDGKILLHDLKVDRPPFLLDLFDYPICCFRPADSHRKLYYSQKAAKIMSWTVPTLSKNARYRKHCAKVTSIVFLSNAYELLSIGLDGLLVLWDCRSDTIQEFFDLHEPLSLVLASSTSKFCVIAAESPKIFRCSLCSYKVNEYSISSPAVAMKFSQDEEFLAVGDKVCRIVIFSVVDMERKWVIKGHTNLITELQFFKDKEMIMSASKDHTLVQWSLKSLDKAGCFYGHLSAVLCMLLFNGDTRVASGAEDGDLIVWTIDGVKMHTIKHSSPVTSVRIAQDGQYLISTERNAVNFWQMANLTLVLQKEIVDAQCVELSGNGRILAVAQNCSICVEENPIKCENIRVVGMSKGSSHKFLNYVLQVLTDSIRSDYLDSYNSWIFTPYLIGIAHLLSYKNKYDILYRSLIECDKKASFCFTINNESPLSINVSRDHKSCIEICLKYLKKEFSAGNTLAYIPLGRCLTEINLLDIPSIPKLYESLLIKDSSTHLPNYCVDGAQLPTICYSDTSFINVESLLSNDLISTHGQSIVFSHSICPLRIETGTMGSIEFSAMQLSGNFQVEVFTAAAAR